MLQIKANTDTLEIDVLSIWAHHSTVKKMILKHIPPFLHNRIIFFQPMMPCIVRENSQFSGKTTTMEGKEQFFPNFAPYPVPQSHTVTADIRASKH